MTGPVLGGLAGAANLNLATATAQAVSLSVGQNGQNTTYSGALSGAGGLTKTGSGTFTVGNTNNTYAGPTAVNQGTLQLGAAPTAVNLAVGGAHAWFVRHRWQHDDDHRRGGDFWGGTEQGYYVYEAVPTNQNFDVAVHMATFTTNNTDGWSKIGIMARATDSTNAANVNTVINPETWSNGVNYQWTNVTQNNFGGPGPGAQNNGLAATGGVWLSLVYTASTDTFTAYWSTSTGSATVPSGSQWNLEGSYTVPMSEPTFNLGVAATSHSNANSYATATFDNFSNLFGSGLLPATTTLSIAARRQLRSERRNPDRRRPVQRV